MSTATKTDFLISEVQSQIKQSLNKWYVGTSERDNVWRMKNAEMVVFNVLDHKAIQAAYDHFVSAGMRGKKPIGRQPNYLYLYCMDGRLPNGFVY